jgi:hypothetical protein
MDERFDSVLDYAVDILRSPHPMVRIREGLERRAIAFLGKDQVKIYDQQEANNNS